MVKTESTIQKMLTNRMVSTYQSAETKAVTDIISFVTPLFERRDANAIISILDILDYGIAPFPSKEAYYTYNDCIIGIALAASRMPKNKYPAINCRSFIAEIIDKGLKNTTDLVELMDAIALTDLLRYTDLSSFGYYDRLLTILMVKDAVNKSFSGSDYQHVITSAMKRKRLCSCLDKRVLFLIVLLKKRKMFGAILNSFKKLTEDKYKERYGSDCEDMQDPNTMISVYQDSVINENVNDLLYILEKVRQLSKQYDISLDNSIASLKSTIKPYEDYYNQEKLNSKDLADNNAVKEIPLDKEIVIKKYKVYTSKSPFLHYLSNRSKKKRSIILPGYSRIKNKE